MAVGAGCAKHAGMGFWFGVAGHAFLGSAFKLAIGMAIFANGGGMGAGEGEFLGVLFHGEVGHGVVAIVAVQAVFAVSLAVFVHKGFVGVLMAVGAGGEGNGKGAGFLVTGGAF